MRGELRPGPVAHLSTKADIEALRADIFKSLNEQSWKLAGIVLAAMGFVVAAVKVIS